MIADKFVVNVSNCGARGKGFQKESFWEVAISLGIFIAPPFCYFRIVCLGIGLKILENHAVLYFIATFWNLDSSCRSEAKNRKTFFSKSACFVENKSFNMPCQVDAWR
jgi:hypothetical protein